MSKETSKSLKPEDEQSSDTTDYHYDEEAEGHENQLEFDRDYATYDALEKKGLIGKEQEKKVREALQDPPDPSSRGLRDGSTEP